MLKGLKPMDVTRRGLRPHDIHQGLHIADRNVGLVGTHLEITQLVGMAAALASAIKGHEVVQNAQDLKTVAAEQLDIDRWAFPGVIGLLEEVEYVRNVQKKGDVISGFFIILEDQVRIGDLARINGVTGNVEQVKLRTIVLRDGEGVVQAFPNGAITSLANLSKHFSYALVDVRIAYSENMDRVIGTVREIGASMERDPVWGPLTMAPLDVLGIESLDGGVATLRVRFKVLPLHQGQVANELRRRLLGAFIGRGIHPYAV